MGKKLSFHLVEPMSGVDQGFLGRGDAEGQNSAAEYKLNFGNTGDTSVPLRPAVHKLRLF